MSKSFEQLGCSKINIGLAITGKRDDGYHDIDSIFQSIRLSDSIYFAKHHSVVFSGGARVTRLHAKARKLWRR